MFYLKIAERCFLINNRFEYIKKMCEKYTVAKEDTVQATPITVSVEEILSENKEAVEYPPAYLECLAIYRKICSVLSSDNTFLFHCSAIAFDGEGVLFTAPSGTGKSTHARLWRECFGERVTIINDDKPLLRVKEDGIYVYGTPWCGKHGIETNTSVKVKAVAIIERAAENATEGISFEEGYPVLFAQTHRPSDAAGTVAALRFIDLLAKNTELYKIKCNISEDAAIVAKKTIFGDKKDR